MNSKGMGKGEGGFGMHRTVMAIAIGALFSGGAQVASALTISGTVYDSANAALTVPFSVLTKPTGSTTGTGCTSTTGANGAYTGAYTCTVADGFSGDVYLSGSALGMLFAKATLSNASGTATQNFTARTDVLTITGTVTDTANAAVSSASFGLSGNFNPAPEYNCSLVNSSNGNYTCALDTTAAGGTLTANSNATLFSGYTLTSAATQTHNFSALVTHTISGALKNPDGSAIASAWIYRWDVNSGTGCSQTDANGNYSCLVPDSYTGKLTFQSNTGMFLGEVNFSSSAVTADQTVNATRWPQISGVVKDSAGAPLSGVIVYQYSGNSGVQCAQSDANGVYSCAVPNGFTGTLQFNKSGYVFDNVGYTSAVTADISTANVAAVQTWNIAGTVTDSNNTVLGGVSVTIQDGSGIYMGSAQSDSSGNFSVAVRAGFTGKLTFYKQGYLFNLLNYAQVSQDLSSQNVQALPAWLISGTVKDSDSTTALQYVSVRFVSGNTSVGCATTDATGAYTCAVPQGFSGSLKFYSTGKVFADLALTNVTADASNQNIVALTTYAISGTIKDSSGQPLVGVSVSLRDAQNTNLWNYCGLSDSNGAYQCMVPSGYNGAFMFQKTGYWFNNATLSNVTAAASGQDVAALATYAITGTVKDGSGAAIAGASINLTYNTGSGYTGGNCATSASDGTYTCPAPAGATSINVGVSKSGYAFTAINQGGLSANLNNANILGVATPLTIIGVVKDAQGSPLAGTFVSWSDPTGINLGCGVSGADGSYSCPVPQNFSGTVRVFATGALFLPKNYAGLTANSVNDDIQAIAAITLSGTVKDAGGNVLAGTAVNYYDATRNTTTYCAISGSDGSYSCLVPQGLLGYLSAGKSGSVFSRLNLTQALNTNTAGQDFTAASVTHTISGTVSDNNGPVVGAWTYWGNANDSGNCGFTDSNGNFTCLVADGFSGDIGAAKLGYQTLTTPVTSVSSNLSGKNITLAAAPISTPAFSTVPANVLAADTKIGMGRLVPLYHFQLTGIGSQTLSSVKVRIANPLGNLAAGDFSNIALYKFNGSSYTLLAGTEQTTVDVSGSGDTVINASGAAIDQAADYVIAATIAAHPTDGASFTVTIPVDAVTLSANSPANSSAAGSVKLTIDAIAPTVSGAAMSNIGTNSVSYTASSSEAGTGYFVVLPASAAAPDTTQVIAGKDSTNAAAVIKDNAVLTGSSAQEFNIAGLAASTSYKLYFVATDGALSNASALDVQSFTTSAAPSYSYDPGPSAPGVTTVAPGGTSTIGNSTTPVDVGEGSTLNVTDGSSGATINLPTPSTGATPNDPVKVMIGGSALNVTSVDSASVIKTATVKINGADTTVLTVTAGKAEVKASAANQPLVALGEGSKAVVVSSVGTNATITTTVDSTTGETSITLAAPVAGKTSSDSAIKMTIGGQDITVKPQAADAVVTVKSITVNGQEVQVISVKEGSAVVTASQANQPLLAVGNGTVVVTGGSVGSEATSKVDSATGSTTLSITSGTVTLPTNAFAEVGNGFAAIKDGKLYAGEVAELNSAGKITSVRVGTQDGNGATGDPLTLANKPVSLTLSASIPNLKGSIGRLGATQTLEQAIATTAGVSLAQGGQTASGVLPITINGATAYILPVGTVTVDTDKPNGSTVNTDGLFEVVSNGVVVTFAPAVPDSRQLATDLAATVSGTTVDVRSNGLIVARINGTDFVAQPGVTAETGAAGAAGFTTGADGFVRYQDAQGNRQTLYPAFIDPDTLRTTFAAEISGLTVTVNDNGTATAKIGSQAYTLTPDYTLSAVPVAQAGNKWWSGSDGKLYIKNGGGKTAQGFTVK